MVNIKNEEGSVLVFTLMTVLVLSILGLAMLPLTVMEYKSSNHFSDYEKSYFLAEAGLEEAVAELDIDWSGYDGNVGTELNEGDYKVVVEGNGNTRKVTATGQIGNIKRKIEANIKKPETLINLANLKDYAIFTQGDLEVEELGNIKSLGETKGIIGVQGNFSFKSAEVPGSAFLKVEGNVTIQQPLKTPYYPSNFPPPSSDLLDLSGFILDDYIEWLKANFNDKIVSYKAPTVSDKNYSLTGTGGPEDQILIFEDYRNEVSLDGTFNGLIIIKNTQKLKIHNESVINGMIIFDGSDLEITEFQISGSKIDVNGSLICTNSATQKGNWKLELNHDPAILSKLAAYLPENYESNTDENDIPIKLLNWKEIN